MICDVSINGVNRPETYDGSGKTTLALEIVAEKEVTYISADDKAYELNAKKP